jgi:diguanylate cyclase (GGDEF)-like protein
MTKGATILVSEKKCLFVGCSHHLHGQLRQICPEIWVDRAESVEEAVAHLKEGGYDYLILDSHVPNSLEFLKQLANVPELKGMKRAVCLDREYNKPHVIHAVVSMRVSRVFYHPIEPGEVAREIASGVKLKTPAIPLVTRNPKKERTIGPLLQTFKEVNRSRVLRMMVEAPKAFHDPAVRRELERDAHKLKGSLGSFGFPRGTEIAAQLETILRYDNPDASVVTDLCRSILAQLDLESEALVAQNSDVPIVLIFTSDQDLSVDLAAAASEQNIRTLVLNNVTDVKEIILSSSLSAAVVDLHTDREDCLQLIRFLARGHVSRVVALTADSGGQSLMNAAEAGAWKAIERTASPHKILSLTRPLSSAGGQLRVLCVDDDPLVLGQLKTTLNSMGLQTRGLYEPQRFWDELEAWVPDMILLDLDMPCVGGLELCRALRASARWGELPIIMITARDDHDTKFRVFRAGADDFIAKPFLEPELRQRISNRLGRSRVERDESERDPLTGLLTRRKAVPLLRRLLSLASQKGLEMSFAMIDLDRFKSVNDTYGHATGDQVLKTTARIVQTAFRDGDVVARWGGEELVVGACRMSKEMMVNRLRRVLTSIQAIEYRGPKGTRFHTSFSGGIAEFPADGDEVNSLLEEADKALYRAKEEGRARVLTASSSHEVRRVDVALVEDDVVLAEVIRDACEARCISIEHFLTATDFLTSLQTAVPLRQSLILLDYDIPDMDGLTLYRKLIETGVEYKVIMLSGKMGEEETLQALELGAENCLQKPIYLSVLMRYIERHLET